MARFDAQFVLDWGGAVGNVGYVLQGNQLVTDVDNDGTYDAADGDDIETVNYVTPTTTAYYYTCEANGEIKQWNNAALDTEYTY